MLLGPGGGKHIFPSSNSTLWPKTLSWRKWRKSDFKLFEFWLVEVYKCMFVYLFTCFLSSFCVSLRSVMLCTPLRSLSSRVARARVRLDPGGIDVCPDSRATASYSHAFRETTQEYVKYLISIHLWHFIDTAAGDRKRQQLQKKF